MIITLGKGGGKGGSLALTKIDRKSGLMEAAGWVWCGVVWAGLVGGGGRAGGGLIVQPRPHLPSFLSPHCGPAGRTDRLSRR